MTSIVLPLQDCTAANVIESLLSVAYHVCIKPTYLRPALSKSIANTTQSSPHLRAEELDPSLHVPLPKIFYPHLNRQLSFTFPHHFL